MENSYRIVLNLNSFYSDHRKSARIFVNSNIKTVSDLQEKVSKIFNIKNFHFICENQYLPPLEDIRIIQKDDIVWAIPFQNQINEDDNIIENQNIVEECEKPKKHKKKDKRNKIKTYIEDSEPEIIEDNKKQKKNRNNSSEDYAEIAENKILKKNKTKVNTEDSEQEVIKCVEQDSKKHKKRKKCSEKYEEIVNKTYKNDITINGIENEFKEINESDSEESKDNVNKNISREVNKNLDIIKETKMKPYSERNNTLPLYKKHEPIPFITNEYLSKKNINIVNVEKQISSNNNADSKYSHIEVPNISSLTENITFKTSPHEITEKVTSYAQTYISDSVDKAQICSKPEIYNSTIETMEVDTNVVYIESEMSIPISQDENTLEKRTSLNIDKKDTSDSTKSNISVQDKLRLEQENLSVQEHTKFSNLETSSKYSMSKVEEKNTTFKDSLFNDCSLLNNSIKSITPDVSSLSNKNGLEISSISLKSCERENLINETSNSITSSDCTNFSNITGISPLTPNDDTNNISFLKYTSGVSYYMHKLKEGPSFSESEANGFVTKRKRKRVRKRKQNNVVSAHNSESPTNVPVKPMVTKACPSIHIKFKDDEEANTEQIVKNEDPKANTENTTIVEDTEKSNLVDVKINAESSAINDLNGETSFELNEEFMKNEDNVKKQPCMVTILPKIGDYIAFKVLKMSECYTPTMSSFIVGKVIEFDSNTNEVNLEIKYGADQLSTPNGKFSMEEEISEIPEQKTKIFTWEMLMETHLLYP